jgi:hypothetical protein
VWIDEKLTYSYPLRGAVKKRMLLLKGVQGYFSDSVEVAGGEHLIHVRVLSADNSYDQSGSIRGSFAPGSEKLLTTHFDKNNRGIAFRCNSLGPNPQASPAQLHKVA